MFGLGSISLSISSRFIRVGKPFYRFSNNIFHFHVMTPIYRQFKRELLFAKNKEIKKIDNDITAIHLVNKNNNPSIVDALKEKKNHENQENSLIYKDNHINLSRSINMGGGDNTNTNITNNKNVTKKSSISIDYRQIMTEIRYIKIFNRKIEYSYSSICGHLSFLLLAISWTFTDIIWLRIMALLAGICSLFFVFWHPVGQTLWIPFRWNILFFTINIGHIIRLFYKEIQIILTDDNIINSYEQSFQATNITLSEYLELIEIAKIKKYAPKTKIIQEGYHNSYVFLVINGECSVKVNNKDVYRITPGQFIGEMGIRVGLKIPQSLPSTATIETETVLDVISWKRSDLIKLLNKNDKLSSAFQSAVTLDLMQKAVDPHKGSGIKVALSDVNIMAIKQYEHVLYAVLNMEKDVKSWNHTRAMLKRFRLLHNIDDLQHIKSLKLHNWTVEQFERGTLEEPKQKKQKNLIHAFDKL